MISSPLNDSSTDTDFYLEASRHYPLLSAEQERHVDLAKWAAARRCARLLLAETAGRELVLEFCRACRQRPPEVDAFEPRSLYFTLRKDVVDYLPDGKQADLLENLERQLASGRSRTAGLMQSVQAMHWPTTLNPNLRQMWSGVPPGSRARSMPNNRSN